MKLFVLALVAALLPAQIRQPAANIRFGSSLPSTCTANIGQVFFLTSASAGANLYGCTATNTWTVQGSGVGGASNLTTVGAVPYVSASGVLNQDASNFFWDATNHRLGIGTNAPAGTLTVTAGTGNTTIAATTSTGNAIMQVVSSGGGLQMQSVSSGYFSLRTSGAGITALAIPTTGGAEGRVGIGPSNTSPTGTLHVYDATASTGVTTLTVKAGAGQSNPEFVVQNIAGATKVAIGLSANTYPGIWLGGAAASPGTSNYAMLEDPGVATLLNAAAGYFAMRIANTETARFITGGAMQLGAATTDTSLSRISAGIVGVGTGAAGSTAGTLQSAVLKVDGSSGTGITFTTDNAADIGAGGGNRPRNVYIGGSATVGSSGAFGWSARGSLVANANGVFAVADSTGADFGRLQFGCTTSGCPSLKRSTTGLIARLADDSADTWVQASQFRSTLTTPASAVATCTAGTIVADTGFVYVCTAADTWKRVAIATW